MRSQSQLSRYALGGGLGAILFCIPFENSVVIINNSVVISKAAGYLVAPICALGLLGLKRIRLPRSFMLLSLFACWSMFSAAWSIDPARSLVSCWSICQYWMLAFIIVQTINSRLSMIYQFLCFSAGSVVLAGFVVADYLSGLLGMMQRYTAANSDPNEVACALLVSLPMMLFVAVHSDSRKMKMILLVMSFVVGFAALLTGSRGAGVAMFGGGLYCLMLFLRGRRNRIRNVVVLASMTVAVLMLAPSEPRSRITGVFGDVASGELNMRGEIWKAAFEVWREHPAAGIGTNAFPTAVLPLLGVPAVAHSTFISIVVETGLIGAGLFVLFLVVSLFGRWRSERVNNEILKVIVVVWALSALSLTLELRKISWCVFGLVASRCVVEPLRAGRKEHRNRELMARIAYSRQTS